MPKQPSRWVSSSIWWALSLAAIAISGIGLTEAGYSQPAGSFAAALLWVSLGVVGVSLLLEAWRDLFETARYTAWISASVAAFTWFVALNRPGPLPLTVAITSTVIWVASLAYRSWNQSAPSPWPDVLLQHTEPAAIHEVGDVQFTSISAVSIVGGQVGDVEVLLQNTVDAPRTVHLDLTPETRLASSNRAVLVPEAIKVELAGGEVARAVLHCVAVGRAQGRHVYKWQVVTLGRGGKRVRRRRAPSLKVPLLTELISLFSALSIMARGRQVTFIVTPSPTDVLSAHPTFQVESKWKPLGA